MKARYLFIPLFYLVMCSHTCMDGWDDCIEGNGMIKIENRDLDSFNAIEVRGDMSVTVNTATSSMARVETDENLLPLIITRVSGNTLIIETRHHDCLQSSHDIRVEVTTPSLNAISLDGSGLIYSEGFSSDDLNVALAGSGQIEVDNTQAGSVNCLLQGSGFLNGNFTATDIKATVEGSGNMKLNGSSGNAEYYVIGSGHLNAGELATDVCAANISGSGTIDTYVNNALDATISGSGTVTYRGHPVITSKINGSGKIVNKNR